MRTRCSALLLALLVLTGSLYAKILYVDDDAPGDPGPGDTQISDPNENGSADHPFDSIQEAIDAAWALPPYSSVWLEVTGDTIVVAPGHYLSRDPMVYDEINFKGKSVRLVSSAPTDFSVVEQTVLCGVVIFRGDEWPDCRLQGFKIQSLGHGGILGNGTNARISHCIISGNGPCGGTVLKDVQGRISNCLIVDNKTIWRCGVTPVISGCSQLFNCTIANNATSVALLPANTRGIESTRIHNCIIYGNTNGQQQILANALPSGGLGSLESRIDHSLIQGWYGHASAPPALWTTNFEGDPCFVQPGRWEGDVLIEGDYHLKSQGFRWTEREIHGSHWYFDWQTSCAIDAGHPMDTLRDEPERGPDDPEGFWGVNHAIDCGAYGGTSQASMAPTKAHLVGGGFFGFAPPSPPLGIGGVDLRDFLPLAVENSWSRTIGRNTLRLVTVEDRVESDGYEVYLLQDSSPPELRDLACVYMDYILYTIQYPPFEGRLPILRDPKEAKYPQVLTVGSTIETPADLFAPETSPRRSGLVMRGTLAEVLAGTTLDPNELVQSGDVIAIREKLADGAAGEPIALFGRGLGPLLLNGEPTTLIRAGRASRAAGIIYDSTDATSEPE
jgi:hypothetical protein